MQRVSTHNGRGYNPSHNDRTTKRAKTDAHINESLDSLNRYYNHYHKEGLSFEECEKRLYEELFSDYVDARNKRYIEHGQVNKCKDVSSLWTSLKTCPIETIYQLGNAESLTYVADTLGNEIEARKLFRKILNNALNKLKKSLKQYKDNYIITCIATHCDEASIHAHYRAIFVSRNDRGELIPNMSKALEEMGFNLPDPSKPQSRYNNRKMTFDKFLRESFVEYLQEAMHEIKSPRYKEAIDYLSQLDLSPAATSEHLAKNDYIIAKQKSKLAELERRSEYLEEFEQYVKECEDELEREARSKGRSR